MKKVELQKVSNGKIGYLNKHGVKLELAEESTFEYLTLFGFDIDVIIPASTKGISNPDIFIMGTIWKVKTPTSHNEQTIKNRFREATTQSAKVIFDLRFVKSHADIVEKQVIKLFIGNRSARRLIIIKRTGEVIDYIK